MVDAPDRREAAHYRHNDRMSAGRYQRDDQDERAAPTLVVIRGNSGSGKTTVARRVRERYGRGCALIEQDHLRRIVLREHDGPGAERVAPAFIAGAAASALTLGYHVVLEGIMYATGYGDALRRLIAEHPGPAHVFYLDVSWGETVRRHATREAEFTVEDMRPWYASWDLLGIPGEVVIPESSGLGETVATILRTSGLGSIAPMSPCPVTCPRCAEIATSTSSQWTGQRGDQGCGIQ